MGGPACGSVPDYGGTARPKMARRARAWAVGTARGLFRHGTVELRVGLGTA
jgi:hypothetical protein